MIEDNDLNGKWELKSSYSAGIEGASPKGTYLNIQGNRFQRITPDYVFEREIQINKSVYPYQIDLIITNEPDKGKTFLGIYKLENGILSIAHAIPGNPRPVSFESTVENKQILSISSKTTEMIFPLKTHEA